MNKTAVIISLIGVAACDNLRGLSGHELTCIGCTNQDTAHFWNKDANTKCSDTSNEEHQSSPQECLEELGLTTAFNTVTIEDKAAVDGEEGFTTEGTLQANEPKGWEVHNKLEEGIRVEVVCDGDDIDFWRGTKGADDRKLSSTAEISCGDHFNIAADAKQAVVAFTTVADKKFTVKATHDHSGAFAFLASTLVVGASSVFYSLF